MDQNEMDLLKGYIEEQKRQNALVKNFIKLTLVLALVAVIAATVSMTITSVSHDMATTEWFRLYMETDYDYPEIEQSVKQEVQQKVSD